jgi:murein DD-endopeptidase MepM/ murein hydrolase activator NlpD
MLSRRIVLASLAASAVAPACQAEIFEPVAQPSDNPAPFAESRAAIRFWPVITTHPRWREVAFETSTGAFAGVELRRFNAPRPAARADNPTRRHVGIDLFARPGDAVIAVEDGRLVNFYPFLRAHTGEMSYALIVAHEAYVANYGEMHEGSLRDNGLALGQAVSAGQPIAAISDTAQLHFETYCSGTRHGQSWAHGAPCPSRVLNPTRLLLDLARDGQRLTP